MFMYGFFFLFKKVMGFRFFDLRDVFVVNFFFFKLLNL